MCLKFGRFFTTRDLFRLIGLSYLLLSLSCLESSQATQGGTSGGGGTQCRAEVLATHLNIYNWLLADTNGYEHWEPVVPYDFYVALEPERLRILLDKDSDPSSRQNEAVVYQGGNIIVRCDLFYAEKNKGSQHEALAKAFYKKMGVKDPRFYASLIPKDLTRTNASFDLSNPGPSQSSGVFAGELYGLAKDFKQLERKSAGGVSYQEIKDPRWSNPSVPPTEILAHFNLNSMRPQPRKQAQKDEHQTIAPLQFDLRVSFLVNTYIAVEILNPSLHGRRLPPFSYSRQSHTCEHLWQSDEVRICLKLAQGNEVYRIERLSVQSIAKKDSSARYWFFYENPGLSYLGNQNPVIKTGAEPESFANMASQFRALEVLTKHAGTMETKLSSDETEMEVSISATHSIFRLTNPHYRMGRYYPSKDPMTLVFRIKKGPRSEAIISIDSMKSKWFSYDKHSLKLTHLESGRYIWQKGKAIVALEFENGIITDFAVMCLGNGDDEIADSSTWFRYTRSDERYYGGKSQELVDERSSKK